MLTKEIFEEWKSQSTTRIVFKELEATRDALQDDLAHGRTLCATADQTHGNTARIVGNIEGLEQVLNISFEDETQGEEG